jgi:hypothetical protein
VAPPPGFLPRPPEGAVSGADQIPCRSCTEGDHKGRIFVDVTYNAGGFSCVAFGSLGRLVHKIATRWKYGAV